MGLGLETSFTGEDALSATIDIGDGVSGALAFDDTDDVLTLDGLTYTFPVGGSTVWLVIQLTLVLFTLELVLIVLSLITWVTVEQEVLLV